MSHTCVETVTCGLNSNSEHHQAAMIGIESCCWLLVACTSVPHRLSDEQDIEDSEGEVRAGTR